jgi:hypothetical protein
MEAESNVLQQRRRLGRRLHAKEHKFRNTGNEVALHTPTIRMPPFNFTYLG